MNRPGFAGGSNFQVGWSHDEQDDERILPGLKKIGEELAARWMVYRFLLQNHPELEGKTALECLKAGRITEVVGVAIAIAQGTSPRRLKAP